MATSRKAPAPPAAASSREAMMSAVHGIALRSAASQGDLAGARAALDLGADPHERDKQGFTALMQVLKGGRLGSSPERHQCARHLLALGGAGLADLQGLTPLMHAAKAGNPQGVEMMAPLSDPSARDASGLCAMHIAALAGSAACIKILAASGYPLDSASPSGDTPLLAAALEGCEDAVVALAELGADPDARDQAGLTPIMHAASLDMEEAILALASKANLAAVDKRGNTALMAAASAGSDLAIRALVGLIDPWIKNAAGLNALDILAFRRLGSEDSSVAAIASAMAPGSLDIELAAAWSRAAGIGLACGNGCESVLAPMAAALTERARISQASASSDASGARATRM